MRIIGKAIQSIQFAFGKSILRKRALISASVLVAVAATIGYGTIPAANGIITGCFNKDGANLRVIDAAQTQCHSNETKLTWNQTGPQGPMGLTGPAGPAGLSGVAGAQGIQGVQGVAGPAGPSGVSHLYGASSPGVAIDNPGAAVVAVAVPAGSYLIVGKVSLFNSDPDSQEARCSLSTGDLSVVQMRGFGTASISLQNWGSLPVGLITVTCSTFNGAAAAQVNAIAVGVVN